MSDFKSTRLWKSTLQVRKNDREAEARESLRQALKSFRERSRLLAGEIPQDMRDLTVHDVTHLDALWETADTIIGEAVSLTPIEAFVLGGAFLIHDLGLALAALPNGMETLRALPAWGDLIIGMLNCRLGRQPSVEEIANPPNDVIEETKFWMLREIHGQRAEQLATYSWSDNGTSYHLVEQPELRLALGPVIGRIAHSHSWPVEKVSREFPQHPQGAPAGFPSAWTLDSMKLALILRLADAAHIDARRAPPFLTTIRRPGSSSLDHWKFQEKLNQVTRDGDRLLYSGQGFLASEAQAWWLCSDTLQMIDKELREVDNLNVDLKRTRFAARGVVAVEEPTRLAQLIPTTGWTPVDARIRVGHVASLVKALGGEQLYGDDQTVPLRELIQNATDAVRARRILEGFASDWGEIVVRLGNDSFGQWIEVEDNGVGMSVEVLTGAFLDFGSSFWASPEAATQFPTLLSKGFQSTGRFGIGFFSVFMWADRVHVITQRYDEARGNTRVLEFGDGLESRPLLRTAKKPEWIKGGGTRVRVWPRDIEDVSKHWIRLPEIEDFLGFEETASPIQVAHWLCPTLDVNLSFQSPDGKIHQLVLASDWTSISGSELLRRTGFLARKGELKIAGENVRPIYQGDKLVGRGCIMPGRVWGIVSVGGLRSLMRTAVSGVLTGHATLASRHRAEQHASQEVLALWATEQATLIPHLTSDLEPRAECAQLIAALGGEIGDLPIARAGKEWLTFKGVVSWAADKESVFVIDLHDEHEFQDKYGLHDVKNSVIVEPHVYLTPPYVGEFSYRRSVEYRKKEREKQARRPILRAVALGWSLPTPNIEVWSGEFDIGENESIFVDCEELKRPGDRD